MALLMAWFTRTHTHTHFSETMLTTEPNLPYTMKRLRTYQTNKEARFKFKHFFLLDKMDIINSQVISAGTEQLVSIG